MLPDINDPAAIAEALAYLTPEERRELDILLTKDMPLWMPQVGPQSMALDSPADIIFYGGQAGGGKTDLLLGASLTRQEHSIIFRRESVQLVGMEERMTSILGGRTGYNSQTGVWRLPGDRVLEFGSVKEPDDWMKYQGRPHDLKAFDEITHFLESQFRVLIGWMRTDNPNIRQRVICAGNPPTSSEGEWVIRYWAPWLDPMHPNPAKPGELRWFVTDEDGKDKEVPNGDEVLVGDELMKPKSRTFIRSSVDDNLYLSMTGYKATLQALPEPLRSQMLRGDFGAGRTDPVWQLIPTDWIREAQARWVDKEKKGPMTVMGLDIARGGKDNTVAARRHGTWFDHLKTIPGQVTNDGPKAAGFAIPLLRNGAPVAIDAIGVGGSALDFLQGLKVLCVPVVGSSSSHLTDKTGQLRYRNKRAEMYWTMREALDPTADDPIALPPDPELLVELCAIRYKIVTQGKVAAILVRDKDEVREAIGRSPDKADAIAMTFVSEIPDAVASSYTHRESRDWRLT